MLTRGDAKGGHGTPAVPIRVTTDPHPSHHGSPSESPRIPIRATTDPHPSHHGSPSESPRRQTPMPAGPAAGPALSTLGHGVTAGLRLRLHAPYPMACLLSHGMAPFHTSHGQVHGTCRAPRARPQAGPRTGRCRRRVWVGSADADRERERDADADRAQAPKARLE
jgi:hypothetical protein